MLKGANIATTTQDDDTLVVLYKTTIVRFNDKRIILNSDGHKTATTKRWMNKVAEEYQLPYQVKSKNGNWIVRTPEQEYLFSDGIEIRITPPKEINEGLKVTFGRVAYVLNVGDYMLDLIENNMNCEATGDHVAYVDWSEIIILSEEYAKDKDDELKQFIYRTEQSIEGEIAGVCFIR
jgi:hypothetical protein